MAEASRAITSMYFVQLQVLLAQFLRCDGVVGIAPSSEYPSALARACEDAGLPYISVSDTGDTAATRERFSSFFRRLG